MFPAFILSITIIITSWANKLSGTELLCLFTNLVLVQINMVNFINIALEYDCVKVLFEMTAFYYCLLHQHCLILHTT